MFGPELFPVRFSFPLDGDLVLQKLNPQCAAALAVLLMSTAPALAPAETVTEEVVEDVVVEDVMSPDGEVTEVVIEEPVEVVEVIEDGFASDEERVSYAIGVDIGRSFKSQDIDIDVATMKEALGAAYAGDELRQTEEQSMEALRVFQESMMLRQQAEAGLAGEANREAGEGFLAENGAREGVVTTESGLQYEIIEEGDGGIAGPDDTVQLNYTGKLIDGETFDSSEGRGPANFPVTGVIPGFSEGLQLLPIGTTAKLYIPADLAYGDSPQGPGGPGSTLIFDVELLSIQEAPKAPTLAEQIELAETQLADDLETIREEGEQQIADLKAQMEASGGSSETVGGDDDAHEKKKDLMYD